MQDPLTITEKQQLLAVARQALEAAVNRLPLPPLQPEQFSDRLQDFGACFVTLTCAGELRGCIGSLEAYQPLVEDIRQHAIAAATQDYRFQPIAPEELGNIEIEISYLNAPQPVDYKTPTELLDILRPGTDGVIIRDGLRRATFLPQVWEKIPDKMMFLSHLCEKMGAPYDLWLKKPLQVFVYQVDEFKETQHSN
ncbi:MAG TPA: AmmeMemoRadiSam system protein A [Anaerolineales bacterium]|nr:AmmeMemoRadiSam system protein A [Anaerolineales bacterium]